ncbi:hypothetical protein HOBO_135 [Bacillus phage Hobo]|uniref:Uncharacterized protein n=2 Tax=Caeruleovirus BM15 TaxID=1985178 RepID=A0A0S2MUH8_9CAUD|nr:hypothetical protein FD732_gp207 [Bacillus phage BM15]ALO79542.1 hypothetical protein BM10_138 [Bacillus phage BM15]AXQ66893.1 hypothetical protein HOBO_135 [Bacillus phage Hobo]
MKRPWDCADCGYREIAKATDTFVLCPNCDSVNFEHGSIIEEYDNLADPTTTFKDQFGAKIVVVNDIDNEGDINILPSEHNMFFSREDAIELAKHILKVCGEGI